MQGDILSRLPILSICGFSGCGKTTLIEKILPNLLGRNLKIAVVKESHHQLTVDQPGKDSDRFFKAAADVCFTGTDFFEHIHRHNAPSLNQTLLHLTGRYDLVLVEGAKHSSLPKVWLLNDGEQQPPESISRIKLILGRDDHRSALLLEFLDRWLARQWSRSPLAGLIMFGGRSSRMGQPKHLLVHKGKSWIELIAETLATVVDRVVLAGRGHIPSALSHLDRLPDIPEAQGPLAGILAACRWQPRTSWLVAACDMPALTGNSLLWLLSGRRPGTWGIIPQNTAGHYEPLLAYYDFRLRSSLENLLNRPDYRLTMLAGDDRVSTPMIPEALKPAWRNINTMDECTAFSESETVAGAPPFSHK